MMGVYVEIDGVQLCCYEDGLIERFYNKKWKEVPQTPHKNKDYSQLRIFINNKSYNQSRILAYVYYGFDLNSDLEIDHLDRNPLNNNILNLRILSSSQNQWNKKVKGYFKRDYGFESNIKVNYNVYTKHFKTINEAKNWYYKMKCAFHIIPDYYWNYNDVLL